MGGTKKRSLSASEKSQAESAESKTAKKGKEEKGKRQTQQKTKITVLLDEGLGLNALKGLKGITPQALARNTGVKISVANTFLKSLESRGSVRCVGGYSGHKVYELIQEQSKPQA